ncbi:hypothetical protein GL213_13080 [Halogeometricum borinquense]|uniref:Uncharacterized protein n=1 Tax=Halogeometricum borinquense TaxID=60847 RepID=A0A6C0UD45_9EURY|nr:hypothetical protein [Halogeometricum borinquense]QIB73225.1 hypothetical protein G3I44_02365 [Halogeometricum borinquense]QIQ77379.1 hypothetical protein GL213_13080 [Halogeometricum borinquense]
MPSVRQLVLVVIVLSFAVTVPAAARAPPRAACGVCTDALDTAAAENGITLEREQSAMTVDVAENGSTRWTARVALAAGADRLTNDTLRSNVVADAMEQTYAAATPENVSSHLDGNTLVVTYRDTDAVTSESDVLLFTSFHASSPVNPFLIGGEGTAYVGADELTVRAPDGYAVQGGYGDATTTTDTVRWSGDAAGESSIDRSTTIAFVREDTWFPGVRASFARLVTSF